MKVQVLQENLHRGLSIVGRAVATRSTLPITANVLVASDRGRLKLAATDLDLTMCAWVGAKIDEEGATTIPSRRTKPRIADGAAPSASRIPISRVRCATE